MRTRIACFESENRSDSPRLTASHGKRASRPEREYRLEVRRDERESSPAGRSAQRPSDRPTDRMKESTPRAAPPNQRLPIPTSFPPRIPSSLFLSNLLVFLPTSPIRGTTPGVHNTMHSSISYESSFERFTGGRSKKSKSAAQCRATKRRYGTRVVPSVANRMEVSHMLRARWPDKTTWMRA